MFSESRYKVISSASFDTNISFLRCVLQKLLGFHDFFLFLTTRCRLPVHFNWRRAKIGFTAQGVGRVVGALGSEAGFAGSMLN